MSENLSTKTTTTAAVTNVIAGHTVSAATFQQMLSILNELASHTHIMYDDYSTACNCNCAAGIFGGTF